MYHEQIDPMNQLYEISGKCFTVLQWKRARTTTKQKQKLQDY